MAHELSSEGNKEGKEGKEGKKQRESDEKKAERLWNIMTDMTPPGVLIPPTKEGLEKRILDVKYEILEKVWRFRRGGGGRWMRLFWGSNWVFCLFV
ncbi:hypothetical protein NMY22_g16583 [Coprinellus aureogranulatus]|nr:hypothetical protein NMY22_g16583 [Coprinellus aureogranulatus]